jgi:DNA-binding MarR family transcriptional regulator
VPTRTDTEFTAAWEALMVAARRYRGREAQGCGGELSLAQFQLLERLLEGPAPVGVLREHAGVSYPTATRSLDALAEKGLVVRSADPADRRVALIELTDAGRERVAAKRRSVQDMRRRIAAHLSDEELPAATALLRRLADAVEAL